MADPSENRRLFEVAGQDPEFRPSPYCWRTRMALAHKRMAFEPVPWRAVEKRRIARSGGGTVPVLVDGARWVRDSWQIAIYLDQTYPSNPLFAGVAGLSHARFLNSWADSFLHPLVFRAVIGEQYPLLSDLDKPAYLERTLKKFGHSVEEMGRDPEIAVSEVSRALEPVSSALSLAPFLGGETPDYCDYVIFGTFQWARVASRQTFWEQDSLLDRWFSNLLDRFEGRARAQPARSHWP